LALGADEKDRAAICYAIADLLVGFIQQLDGLLQVKNMDSVALREDVRAHFGVPLVGSMSEVDAALEERFHRYSG